MNLTQEHAYYTEMKATRTKARVLWEGACTVKAAGTTYLRQTSHESAEDYANRLYLATYINYPAKVVAARMALLYRKEPERALPASMAQPLQEDIDNCGTPVSLFFQGVARDAQVDGIAFVLADKTKPPVDSEGKPLDVTKLSAQQEADFNIRPYLRAVRACDLLDWSFGDDGRLDYAVIRVCVSNRETNIYGMTFGMPCEDVTQYQVWTRTDWRVFEKGESADQWNLVDQGPHPVGEVPLTAFYGIKTGHFKGDPVTKDILDHCLTIYNLNASRYAFEDLTCNPVPYVFAESKPELIKVGGSNAMFLEKSETNGPEAGYLEVTGQGSIVVSATTRELQEQIYAIALSEAKMQSKQVEGADTQRENRMIFAASIDVAAQLFEEAEAQALLHFIKWLGADGEVAITYNRDFDEKVIDAAFLTVLFDAAAKGKFPLRQLFRILIDGEVLKVPKTFSDSEKFIDWLVTETDRDGDKAVLSMFDRVTANGEPKTPSGNMEPESINA